MKKLRRLLPVFLILLVLLALLPVLSGERFQNNAVGTSAETDWRSGSEALSDAGQTAEPSGNGGLTPLARKKTASPTPSPTPMPKASAVPKGEKSFWEYTEDDLPEDGSYTSMEDVAGYLLLYGRLPGNFITKKEAQNAGWSGGSLERVLPGMCIGGDRFGNYEGLLPKAKGRSWTECDLNTLGVRSRGAERLVFSNDGLIYYTGDHYDSFQQIYPLS